MPTRSQTWLEIFSAGRDNGQILIGLRNAGRFEDGRHDIDHVAELAADAAQVLDVAGPGSHHALGRPAEADSLWAAKTNVHFRLHERASASAKKKLAAQRVSADAFHAVR
jgi:hypothetical protein